MQPIQTTTSLQIKQCVTQPKQVLRGTLLKAKWVSKHPVTSKHCCMKGQLNILGEYLKWSRTQKWTLAVNLLTLGPSSMCVAFFVRQDQMNTRGSWWYIEVLWSEIIGLCKKLNIIYNIITCNPEPRGNGAERCPVRERIILLNWFFLVN